MGKRGTQTKNVACQKTQGNHHCRDEKGYEQFNRWVTIICKELSKDLQMSRQKEEMQEVHIKCSASDVLQSPAHISAAIE